MAAVITERDAAALTLVVPMPPSTNSLYRNVPRRGRVKTDRYKAWLTEAGYALNRQSRQALVGDVALTITVGPRNRSRDLDNCIKAPQDLLQAHGIIVNDSQVIDVRARWSDEVKGCQIDIRET